MNGKPLRIGVMTLWEIWASLMAIKAKKYETRSYALRYRGPLAIHAAKRWTREQGYYFNFEPYRSTLSNADIHSESDLHFGCILAIGYLRAIYRTEDIRDDLSDDEKAFGDYSDGRFAWHIEVVYRLPEPIPTRGAQGLWYWNVPEPLASKVRPKLSAIKIE